METFVANLPIGIFVIDDDVATVEAIGKVLTDIGKKENVTLFTDPILMKNSIHKDIHICIVDFFLNHEMNGLDLIKAIVKINPYCYFIMLSGQEDKNIVIDYMNSVYGARYIDKSDSKQINKIIEYTNDFEDHIHHVKATYDTLSEAKTELQTMKQIIKGNAGE